MSNWNKWTEQEEKREFSVFWCPTDNWMVTGKGLLSRKQKFQNTIMGPWFRPALINTMLAQQKRTCATCGQTSNAPFCSARNTQRIAKLASNNVTSCNQSQTHNHTPLTFAHARACCHAQSTLKHCVDKAEIMRLYKLPTIYAPAGSTWRWYRVYAILLIARSVFIAHAHDRLIST